MSPMRIAEGGVERVRIDGAGTAGDSRSAALRERGRHAHQRAGRRDRPRLDADRRRHPVHRGDPRAGPRQAHPHRPARRRHEGERAGGADVGEGARGQPRHRRRPVREIRRPHPRAGGRHPQGRTERRRRDVRGARVAAHRAHGAQRHGDDRRNLAARPRAADRRREGEGAGRDARRHHHGAAAGAQQEGPRGRAGGGAQGGALRLARGRRRRGCRGPELRPLPRPQPRLRSRCKACSGKPRGRSSGALFRRLV